MGKKHKKMEENGVYIQKAEINTDFLIVNKNSAYEVWWKDVFEDKQWYFLSKETTAQTTFATVQEAKAFIEGLSFATQILVRDSDGSELSVDDVIDAKAREEIDEYNRSFTG